MDTRDPEILKALSEQFKTFARIDGARSERGTADQLFRPFDSSIGADFRSAPTGRGGEYDYASRKGLKGTERRAMCRIERVSSVFYRMLVRFIGARYEH